MVRLPDLRTQVIDGKQRPPNVIGAHKTEHVVFDHRSRHAIQPDISTQQGAGGLVDLIFRDAVAILIKDVVDGSGGA